MLSGASRSEASGLDPVASKGDPSLTLRMTAPAVFHFFRLRDTSQESWLGKRQNAWVSQVRFQRFTCALYDW